MLAPIRVEEVMHAGVETIGSDAPVTEVATRLRAAEAGSLVVVREGEAPGIVTETDLVDLFAAGKDLEGLTAASCLSSPLITIGSDESVTRAAALLREHAIKKLPVTDGRNAGDGDSGADGDGVGASDDDFVGIVTTTDLSYYLPRLSLGGAFDEREGKSDRGRELAGPEMAYEGRDWEFDYEGNPETIDVGDVVRFRKTLSDADVRAFADASGDTNRLHLEEEFAAETRFGGRIVHGTLVGGTVSAALARLPGLTIYLAQDVSYQGAVDVGETVTAVCEVVEAIGDERYRLSTTVFDGDGERAIEGEAVVLVDDLPGDAERPANSA